MPHPLIQVDAFTDKAFTGNPAAVCLLNEPAKVSWMQSVAREMNLSETAFVHPEDDIFRLRWFTPAVEVELCGHATLASAHVLWEEGRLAPMEEARFLTQSGLLTCTQNEGWIEMDFPATPVESADPPSTLAEGLGITPHYVGVSKYDYLVEVPSEEIVRTIEPEYDLLAALETRGVIVTSAYHGLEYDFISRFFAPGHGIDEDPVTGSAHCALGPFWGARLKKKELVGYQASARGGIVRVRLQDHRTILAGQAVTVMKGELV